MRRGTTPTCTFTVDADLSAWHCYLTFQVGRSKLTKTPEDLIVTPVEGGSAVSCVLSQEETLAMKRGRAKVQLRAVNPQTAVAVATEIETFNIDDVLYEEVIE